MERQLRINWSVIVEEAKQRRKSQRLTQSRLALLAGVSTPTISRFESGEKDIQLSTVNSILRVLGMLDERRLDFPDDSESYDSMREVIVFEGVDGAKSVRCAISREALEDHFGRGNNSLSKMYRANRGYIQHQARRKYLLRELELDQSVLVKTLDF